MLHKINDCNYEKVFGYLDTDTAEEEEIEMRNNKTNLYIINIINLFIQFVEIVNILQKLYQKIVLKKDKLIIDLVYVLTSIHVTVYIMIIMEPLPSDDKLHYMKFIRHESLFIMPLLFIKFTDILTLFDSISPFVDIVFQILRDIIFFMFIFCITIFMASSCFYIIGRNQIYFDEITIEEFENIDIPYDTMNKAIWYTWLLTLG